MTDTDSQSICLVYHDVFAEQKGPCVPMPTAYYHLSTGLFKEHIESIRQSGLKVRTVNEIFKGGCAPSVVLTFDDGWRGAFENAMPVIEKEGWSAVFFITGEYVGKQNYCDREILTRALHAGMEIGIHGMTHRSLHVCSDLEIRKEFSRCRELLETITEEPVCTASLPNGDTSDRVIRCARDIGIQILCTSRPGINTGETSPFNVARMTINSQTTGRDIARYCQFCIGSEVFTWRFRWYLKKILGMERYKAVRAKLLAKQRSAPRYQPKINREKKGQPQL